MLINFSIGYYRSFGAEQTLNMVATALKDHPGHCVEIPNTKMGVLQTSVIYGANASGKSNLVKAILFTQMLITGNAKIGQLALDRFRFLKKEQPSSFEFRFLAHGQVFVYGFTLTPEAVVEEWLDAATDKGREITIFSRHGEDIHIGKLKPFGKGGSTLSKALAALKLLGVRNDQLLLNRITDLSPAHRGELLNRVVWWFTDCLCVVQAEAQYGALLDMLSQEEPFRKFCGAFLKNVGTGIEELCIDSQKLDADKLPKRFVQQLQAPKGQDATIVVGGPGLSYELDANEPDKVVRKNITAKHHVREADYAIGFQEESDGTQRCLNLLPAIYHLTRAAKVFVVDEIDRSLHPLLCHALLKLFLDACPHGCQQMIVTTHETHLLDLALLRRDEIWFVEKDKQQQSCLSSLGDLNARKDLRIEKGYLQGRFGGIPFIGDTKRLMDLIQCPVDGVAYAKETTT